MVNFIHRDDMMRAYGRLLCLIFFTMMALLNYAGCATRQPPTKVESPTASKSAALTSEGKVSQKRDPSRIYGDERLNLAYEEWAQLGYPPHPDSGKYSLDGKASWYGPGLNGNHTANGEIFDMYGMSAAHKKLPFGTIVVVTNENNGKSVVVRINDRGPFVAGRIIDLSYGAAYMIDMIQAGVAPVKVEIIKLGAGKKDKW